MFSAPNGWRLLFSVSLFFLLVRVAPKSRSLRLNTPRLCRFAVFEYKPTFSSFPGLSSPCCWLWRFSAWGWGLYIHSVPQIDQQPFSSYHAHRTCTLVVTVPALKMLTFAGAGKLPVTLDNQHNLRHQYLQFPRGSQESVDAASRLGGGGRGSAAGVRGGGGGSNGTAARAPFSRR